MDRPICEDTPHWSSSIVLLEGNRTPASVQRCVMVQSLRCHYITTYFPSFYPTRLSFLKAVFLFFFLSFSLSFFLSLFLFSISYYSLLNSFSKVSINIPGLQSSFPAGSVLRRDAGCPSLGDDGGPLRQEKALRPSRRARPGGARGT